MNKDIILRTINPAFLKESSTKEDKYVLVKLSEIVKYSVIFFAYRSNNYRSTPKKKSESISHYRKTKFGKVVSFNTVSGLLTVNSYKNSSRTIFNTFTSNMKLRYVEPEDVIMLHNHFLPLIK